ncbi:hypothetical protein BH09ACT10_BH09ACT10_30870 [soil metagenome]
MHVTHETTHEENPMAHATLLDRSAHGARRLAATLSGLAGVGIVLMVVLTLVDVGRRAAFDKSISGVIEITEVGLVAVVFLGLMGAQLNDRLIRTPVVTNRLPGRVAHLVRAIALVLSVLLLVWVIYETTLVAINSVERREYRGGLTEVPIWPARILIPIGLTGLALALLVDSIKMIANFVTNAQPEIVEYESNL